MDRIKWTKDKIKQELMCNQTQISIGQYSSKYLKYLNKYSFIKEFVKDIKNIAI